MNAQLRALLEGAVWHRLPRPREAHISVPHPVAEAFVDYGGKRLRFVRWSNRKTKIDSVQERTGATR